MPDERYWKSFAGGGDDRRPSDERRRELNGRLKARQAERGALLAVVEVHVYEHGELAQISFPDEATLSPTTERAALSNVAERAPAAKLAEWR